MKKIIYLITIAFFSFSNLAEAQIYDKAKHCIIGPDGECLANVISTAVPFLNIVSDARSGGLGDAGIGLSPDANSVFYNPSKIVFAEKNMGFALNYTPWFKNIGVSDVNLSGLSGYGKIDANQSIGGSLKYFSLGEINFTNEDGGSNGSGNPIELELKGVYSRKLSENFAAGIGLKYIHSNLASGRTVGTNEINPANVFAADISFSYNNNFEVGGMNTNLLAGLALSHIGSKVTYIQNVEKDYLPANIGLGLGWNFEIDSYNEFTFLLDINKLMVPTPCQNNDCDGDGILNDDDTDYPESEDLSIIKSIFSSFGDAEGGAVEELRELMYSFGLEYWYNKQFAARIGYFSEHHLKGNRKFMTFGAGLKYNSLGFNFSYLVPTGGLDRSPLDGTLRFSFLFDLSKSEE